VRPMVQLGEVGEEEQQQEETTVLPGCQLDEEERSRFSNAQSGERTQSPMFAVAARSIIAEKQQATVVASLRGTAHAPMPDAALAFLRAKAVAEGGTSGAPTLSTLSGGSALDRMRGAVRASAAANALRGAGHEEAGVAPPSLPALPATLGQPANGPPSLPKLKPKVMEGSCLGAKKEAWRAHAHDEPRHDKPARPEHLHAEPALVESSGSFVSAIMPPFTTASPVLRVETDLTNTRDMEEPSDDGSVGEECRYHGVDRLIWELISRRCWTCCGFVIFLVCLILFCSSFKRLGPYKYGFLQNQISRRVYWDLWEDSVWVPGVYFVGFWNGFLSVPSTISTIQYSNDQPEDGVMKNGPLYVRSNDKVSLYLDVSVQFLRKKGELVQLFQKAMTATLQESLFNSLLRAELTKVMSRHDASDCWKHREALIKEFTKACEKALARSHAVCWGLQFYRVEVDERYEKELVMTQVQKQRKRIEEARKQALEVRAETKVLLANITNRIKVVEAEARAGRYQLEVAARTAAEVAKVSAEATAVQYVQEALRLSNSSTLTEAEMTEYQQALMLTSSLKTPRLFYGLSSPPTYVAMSSATTRRLEGSVESHWPPPWLEADVQSQLPSPESSGPSRGPPPWKEPSHEAHIVSHEPLLEL